METNFDFDTVRDIADRGTRFFKHLRFGNKAQLAFLEDLHLLINDGIPANRAIEMMAEVTRGVPREVALTIAQKISEGKALADGMREWFPESVVEIIRVGEEGGALNETIRSSIKTMTQRTSSIGALIAAISYPILVIVMACIIIVYLNNSVFVQFRNIKPIEQWPQSGRDLVNLAEIIQYWWWLAVLGVIGILVFFRIMLSNYVGPFRSTLDKIPPFSLYRHFSAARLMETMGLLVANGVVFKNAITVMQYQANPYINSHLAEMQHLLSTGRGTIADVLATGLISDDDIMRLRVMAEVRGFEHGLIRMGVRGSAQTTSTLKLISRIVGGILLVIGAYLIIVIVKGIYLTGMSMGNV